ncbi:MAG: hypothetical protein GXO80_08310 [Chlorobi bacterium]|nr:hypothetical protein [Chlorobiota bacterium]
MKNKKSVDSKMKFVEKLPDYLTYLGIGVLLFEEFLRAISGYSILKTQTNDLRISVGIAVITLVSLNLIKKMNNIKNSVNAISGKYLGVLEVLQSFEFLDFKNLLETSTTVKLLTLSGTKTGHLGDTNVRDILADNNRKSSIILLLGNPFSEAIITRYKNDEPDTYEAGTDGIKRRLIWLYKILQGFPETAQKKLDIRVFDNYPTISVIQADKDIYSTVYGYKLRGGDCPKIHVHSEGDYGKFILNHFDKVYNDAVPIETWVRENIDLLPELTSFIK